MHYPDQRQHLAEVAHSMEHKLRAELLRSGTTAIATDDVLQEVYLRLLRYGGPEELTDPDSFIRHVAVNVNRDFQARERHAATISAKLSISAPDGYPQAANSSVRP